jgi:hypothetical protein
MRLTILLAGRQIGGPQTGCLPLANQLFLHIDSLCFGLRACQKIRKEKIKFAPKRQPLKGNSPIYALGK